MSIIDELKKIEAERDAAVERATALELELKEVKRCKGYRPAMVKESTAAAIFDISQRQVANLVERGEFPRPRRLGSSRVYLVDELLAYAKKLPVFECEQPNQLRRVK